MNSHHRTPRREVEPCCPCLAAYNRCRSDDCPCYTKGELCRSPCETIAMSADCLNRQITRCSCNPPYHPSSLGKSQDEEQRSPLDPVSPMGPPGAPSVYCDRSRCECYRYREPCGPRCGCRGAADCRHSAATRPLYARPKEERPADPKTGCKCSIGKKACFKSKCVCRQLLKGCGSGCRCGGGCHNDAQGPIAKATRMAFLYPDQEAGAVVVRLLGPSYAYQVEFVDTDKGSVHSFEHFYETLLNLVAGFNLPLTHIMVYASRSPCFHQDCEPRCEVLAHCESQKACARLMSVAYGQLQKHLGSADLQMNIKFLCPYLKRGDLYTQQGIHDMMEAGIQVEPMTLKEWAQLLEDPGSEETSTQALIDHWADHRLDATLKQAQHYVNGCRRSAGLRPSYWASGFHELLKATTIAAATAQHKLDSVARTLGAQAETEATLSALREAGGTRGDSLEDLLGHTPNPSWQRRDAAFHDGLPPYADRANGEDSGRSSAPLPISQTLEALNMSPAKGEDRRARKKAAKKVTRSQTGGNLTSFLRREKRDVSSPRRFMKSRDERPEISAPVIKAVQPPVVPPLASLEHIDGDATGTEDEAAYLDTDQLSYVGLAQSHTSNHTSQRPTSQDLSTSKVMNESFFSNATSATISVPPKRAPRPEELERIILNFSGRSIDEGERAEMRGELLRQVNELRSGFTRLLAFLEQRSNSTPV